MADIRDQLINKSQASIAKAKTPATDRFLPEIPNSRISTAIPAEVLNAITAVKDQKTVSAVNEENRLEETTEALSLANEEISSATAQIREVEANPFLQIQGLWDKSYNLDFQRGRVKDAKTALSNTATSLDLERQQEMLDLKTASLPLDAYKQITGLQSAQATMQAQQANAIVQSNAARKTLRAQLQLQYTPDELATMSKNKQGDEVWSLQEINAYKSKLEKSALDLESSQLAVKDKKFDLAIKMQDFALANMPLPYLNYALTDALKNNKPNIQIPGTNQTLPTDKVRASVATRMKADQDAYMQQAEIVTRLASNDADFASAMHGVQAVASSFSGDATFANFGNLNMLNISEEVVSEIDFSKIHPMIASETQNVLRVAAELNERQVITYDDKGKPNPQTPVSVQEVFTLKKLIADLKVKTDLVQKATIESQADKSTKAAYTEWFTNGRMQNQDNSAAVLVANSISQPNYAGDRALNAAHEVMLENIYNVLEGGITDIASLEGAEKTSAIFAMIADKGFKGKVTSRDKITKALHTKNADGVTPVAAYIGTKTQDVFIQGFEKLIKTYPEFTAYFNALGNQTGYKNQQAIAASLAELSFKMKAKNPKLPDRVLNQAMANFMDDIIKANEGMWNAQLNPVRGSMMNVLFSGPPAVLVDESITNSFGYTSGQAWDELARIQVMQPQTGLSGQVLQQQPTEQTQFNIVPLPNL